MVATPVTETSRRWRTAFIIATTACLVGAVGAAYAILDQATALDGLQAGYDETRNAANVLARLGPRIMPRATRADLLTVLRQQNPGALIVATDSTVAIGQLTFRFDSRGALRQIDLTYDP